ncbi:MAG TPA: lamin tail domain-containing protein [Anaerolineales bacterium]|nr:lamin tail domain-containing protein [Anaerolineales bacterium]
MLINEVAWAGTLATSDDEWIELYNPSSTATIDLTGWILKSNDNTPTIQLTGHSIPPNDFLLLTRRDGTFTGGLTADITSYGSTSLSNNGEVLSLIDSAGRTIDTANSDGGAWPAGIASPTYASMERVGTTNQWVTYGGTTPLALDRESNAVKGTPGVSNWISTATVTTITSDTPDPSLVNQDVTVSVSVIGGMTSPTGKVNITGANTNCTITLSASGTGSCRVRFTSIGTKTITATYLGNSATSHPPSSDTESHQVSTTVVRTPTRVPTAIPPPPLIAINEFVPRPGHDWNNDGVINTGDEYIELLNHGVVDVNLSGYSLDDEVNIGSAPFRLPAIVLKPGERRVFYGSETGLLLSDGGDGVRLLKPNGQLGDAYNYRVVRFPDQSFCRLPDNGGADDWNQNCFPTPGLQNSLSGSSVNPPTSGGDQPLCPIADTLPNDFVLAECLPFGGNIWNAAYWDEFGWFNERFLPGSPGKWNVFVD